MSDSLFQYIDDHSLLLRNADNYLLGISERLDNSIQRGISKRKKEIRLELKRLWLDQDARRTSSQFDVWLGVKLRESICGLMK